MQTRSSSRYFGTSIGPYHSSSYSAIEHNINRPPFQSHALQCPGACGSNTCRTVSSRSASLYQNGTTQPFGGITYGNWGNGTSSSSQTFGGTTFLNFSNGRQCTSQRMGNQTFTNC